MSSLSVTGAKMSRKKSASVAARDQSSPTASSREES